MRNDYSVDPELNGKTGQKRIWDWYIEMGQEWILDRAKMKRFTSVSAGP